MLRGAAASSASPRLKSKASFTFHVKVKLTLRRSTGETPFSVIAADLYFKS